MGGDTDDSVTCNGNLSTSRPFLDTRENGERAGDCNMLLPDSAEDPQPTLVPTSQHHMQVSLICP